MTPLTWATQKGYLGKQVPDPMGQFLGECVSFWKDYHVDVNKIPYADLYVPGGVAKNIWYEFTPAMGKWFDKVYDAPQIDDSIIYDGNFGDVALYIGDGEVIGQLGDPVYEPVAVRPIGKYLGILRLKGEDEMVDDAAARAMLTMSTLLAQDGVDTPDRQPTLDEVKNLIGRTPLDAANQIMSYEPWQHNKLKVKVYDQDVANASQKGLNKTNVEEYINKNLA